ncbi:BTAD domain-containing putative transcriptional regulator [Nonomuraea typhae]|uniref:BTAD domain-containing putative transcriptional regulator n=1 Tax=Nonomuraea typhae TaxID=2603600 RepID=UPI0015E24DA8|nr:BTAD domain-containing putative transcriptional regulator [Nonomuraea typhae]
MRISILGPLEVENEGAPVPVGGARVRALLALLALEAGQVVTAERLIDALWPEQPPANAANALQTLVKRLRTALRPHLDVTGRPGGYLLPLPRESVDAHAFTAAVRDGNPAEGLAMWRGPALADLLAVPHLAAVATGLEEERLLAVEAHAEAVLDAGGGDLAELAASLSAEAAAHPLRERLAALAMRSLAAAGRQADALTLFERVRSALAGELGVDPGPGLRAAHLAVLKGETPVRPAARARGNVRPPLTGFVGRDAELARLLTLLGEVRLATIAGPGGAGKTRLATEAALRSGELLGGETWMVELAPVTDPADVPGALLDALGLRDDLPGIALPGEKGGSAAEGPVQRVAERLGRGPALIVLDNCEHLVEAAAWLAERLLAACPGLRVLATSREPLNLPGEHVLPLPPLALPPEGVDAAGAAGYAAVRLLVERAVAARPSFRLDEGNAADVAAVCRRLDGMPLAIELAAARLRTMTVRQLAERLDDRFRLLTGGSRTALPRQQTLRALVEWSWDLLTGEERALAGRLAVFAGGATLEAVEAVCGGDAGVLGALADKSLVQLGDDGRYRMLETIRAYALERLAEAGEVEEYRRRLAVHLRDLAEAAVPWLRTSAQIEWIERLGAERDNCAAALRWSLEAGDADLALRLCGALNWYWWMCGYRTESAQWAEQALALAGPTPPPGLAGAYAACRFAVGVTMFGRVMVDRPLMEKLSADMDRLVDLAAAEGPLHPMLRIARAVMALLAGREEDAYALLDSYAKGEDLWLASSALMIRGPRATEESLERAVAGFRKIGDRWGLSEALLSLGAMRAIAGRPAGELFTEVRSLTSAWISANESVSTLTRLALIRARGGDLEGAAADLVRARLGVSAEINPDVLLQLQFGEALVAYQRGDHPAALAAFEKAIEGVREVMPIPQLTASVRTQYGRALVASGDRREGLAQHRQALEVVRTAPDLPVLASVFCGFALAALAGGDPERAAVLFGAAADESGPDVAAGTAAARRALGEDRYAALRAEGAALTREEVYALVADIT